VSPSEGSVWIAGGRWGPRRVRVHECVAILAAELVYSRLICDGVSLRPGGRFGLSWTPINGESKAWDIEAEVLPNAVWRKGRVFLRCPSCGGRATRLYVPRADLPPKCRRCWGLNYGSQTWSYKPTGWLGRLFGPMAYVTTSERRKQRQIAAKARYEERRPFLRAPMHEREG